MTAGGRGRPRFWGRWEGAMRAVGLVLALLGALGLAVEVFDAGLPVRVPLVVSGIVLVFGLLLLTAGGHDDDP